MDFWVLPLYVSKFIISCSGFYSFFGKVTTYSTLFFCYTGGIYTFSTYTLLFGFETTFYAFYCLIGI